jgi:hypothetical protein
MGTKKKSTAFELESANRIYLEVADEMLFTFHANELLSKTRNAFKYFNHGLRSMCTQLPNYCSLFMQINRVFFDYKTVIESSLLKYRYLSHSLLKFNPRVLCLVEVLGLKYEYLKASAAIKGE